MFIFVLQPTRGTILAVDNPKLLCEPIPYYYKLGAHSELTREIHTVQNTYILKRTSDLQLLLWSEED